MSVAKWTCVSLASRSFWGLTLFSDNVYFYVICFIDLAWKIMLTHKSFHLVLSLYSTWDQLDLRLLHLHLLSQSAPGQVLYLLFIIYPTIFLHKTINVYVVTQGKHKFFLVCVFMSSNTFNFISNIFPNFISSSTSHSHAAPIPSHSVNSSCLSSHLLKPLSISIIFLSQKST